jgi:hypothetical protein
VGVGDPLFRFDLLLGVGLGEGVGETFFRFEETLADGVGVALLDERVRCLREELGVGSGSKAFLIFVSTDSSAECAVVAANKSAPNTRQQIILFRAIDIVGCFCETPVTGV